jgi:hypothetical protein
LKLNKLVLLCGFMAAAGSPALAQPLCSDLSLSNLRGDANVPGGITGTATNTSSHELQSSALFFNLYDSTGAVVGQAVASQMNLASGQRWNFQAATAQPFAKFELKSSNCVAAR